MDTDGDGYPDHEAASLCAGIESYCLKVKHSHII